MLPTQILHLLTCFVHSFFEAMFICLFISLSVFFPRLRPSSPQDAGGGAVVPSGQRFLLKWSVPLGLVEQVEFGSSEEMGDSAPFPAPHSGEKLVINAKPSTSLTRTRSYQERI